MLFHLVLAINTILSCFFKSSNFYRNIKQRSKSRDWNTSNIRKCSMYFKIGETFLCLLFINSCWTISLMKWFCSYNFQSKFLTYVFFHSYFITIFLQFINERNVYVWVTESILVLFYCYFHVPKEKLNWYSLTNFHLPSKNE